VMFDGGESLGVVGETGVERSEQAAVSNAAPASNSRVGRM
jgi:hypothetical protein